MTDDFRRQTFDIIQQLTGDRNVVVIPRLFVTLLEGDYIAAAILNQIVYWTDHTRDPEGWFYKSYDEWTAETGLSKYQVNRSIKGDKRVKGEKVTLASVGVETKRKKAPNGAPTIHYRINREMFIDALAHAVNPIVNNVDYANVNIVDDGKSTNSTIHSEQSQRSSFTETTTEKNKNISPPPSAGLEEVSKTKPDAKQNGSNSHKEPIALVKPLPTPDDPATYDDWLAYLRKEFKIGANSSWARNLYNMFKGRARTGAWKENNILPAATLDQVRRWITYEKNECMKEHGKLEFRYRKAEAVNGRFLYWRERWLAQNPMPEAMTS